MTHPSDSQSTASLPPGQQLAAPGKWPLVGEREPRRDSSPWQIELCGLVRKPFHLSLAELQDWPQREQVIDIHCVTRWSKLGMRFRGVPLKSLIERAEPLADAAFVSFVARSERNHSTSLPLTDALGLESLVALEADGTPLGAEHGGPVRMVVPGRYFYKSLKWLARIELLASDRLGYWEATAGYHNHADPRFEERYLSTGLTAREVREILRDRDVSGRELLSLAAAGFDLAGLQAENAVLRNADFRDCHLEAACFDRANLTNAHFSGADLRGASFRNADLEGADFSGADLRGASLLADSMVAASFCANDGRQGARLDAGTVCRESLLDQLAPRQQEFLRRSPITLVTT